MLERTNYRCRGDVQGTGTCPTGLLNAREVEAAVVAQVKELAKSGALRERVMATLAEGDEGETELRATKTRLEARLTELATEAKRLLGAFKSTDAGGKLLAGRLGDLERETDQQRAELADVERRLRACAALKTEGQHVATLLDGFEDVWDALVPEERREVLHALIDKVGFEPVMILGPTAAAEPSARPRRAPRGSLLSLAFGGHPRQDLLLCRKRSCIVPGCARSSSPGSARPPARPGEP